MNRSVGLSEDVDRGLIRGRVRKYLQSLDRIAQLVDPDAGTAGIVAPVQSERPGALMIQPCLQARTCWPRVALPVVTDLAEIVGVVGVRT